MANQNVKAKQLNKKPSKVFVAIVNFFRSLFSNQAAIDCSKNSKWYTIIIFILVAAFLPVVPLMVNAAKVNGSSYLGSYHYGLETKLTLASEDLKDRKCEFKIEGENKLLHYYKDGVKQPTDITYEDYSKYLVSEIKGDSNKQIEFQVYYTPLTYENIRNNMVKSLDGDNNTYLIGTSTKKNAETDPTDSKYYIPSYMILSEGGLFVSVHKSDATDISSYTDFQSDWKHVDADVDIIAMVLNVPSTTAVGTLAYYEAVYNNWADIVDATYESAKSKNVLFSTLIYFGVYLALIVFMGLMIFLLTRGKKNVFNYLKFWDCLKIVAWTSVCPALLAMILGFLLSSYAVMFFIILIGLRTMWLSMRQLRPY